MSCTWLKILPMCCLLIAKEVHAAVVGLDEVFRDRGNRPMTVPSNVCLLNGLGTSQTSKYVFGVFAYLSYRFHTHMNSGA